jgi:hypothetical protein
MYRVLLLTIIAAFILIFPSSRILAQDTACTQDTACAPESAGQTDAGSAPAPGPDSIDNYTPGWTKTEGMFSYYTDELSKRVLIRIRPDQFEQPYFSSVALTQGTGNQGLAAPQMWFQTTFLFRRVGQYIEYYQPNMQFSTVQGEPMARAVESGLSETILGRSMIEAESENTGDMVIDLSSVLLGLTGIQQSMSFGGYLGISPEGSYIEQVKGFPKNDEIDARLALLGTADPFGNPVSGESRVRVHYSLAMPPDPGYMPRLVDERVGYFVNMTMNYSAETDRQDTRYVRYVNRWRLEKADPTAEVSDPVQPIVYWLDNSIPVEYRDAVRAGILAWNEAFLGVGISNAMEVRQKPDDADWDSADARYHTVRWFIGPNDNYAIGPSLTDPRTGEIYDADIGINADMMRGPFFELRYMLQPLTGALELISPPGWPNLNGRQVRWNDTTLSQLENRLNRMRSISSGDYYAAMQAFDASRAMLVLQARGAMTPGSPEEAQFVHDYLVSLVIHEVGHTLGLRHNFAGSAGTPYWKLSQSFWTREHGLSQSIMDYTVTNVAPVGKPQGEYFQTHVGDYDKWAIEYAYSPLGDASPQDELPALREIASRAPAYRYGTDEDAYGWTRSPDPDCTYWDLSDDPVRWTSDRVEIAQELLAGILEHWSEPGTPQWKIRNAFGYALAEYQFATAMVPRLIGGIRVYRDHVVDINAHSALEPVSATDQRRALQFLNDKIWRPGAFQFDPQLLSMLGQNMNDTFYYDSLLQQKDFDTHAWVLNTQTSPLYWIYDSLVLQRVLNNQERMLNGEEAFTLTELFDTVRGSIWSEVFAGTSIDSYRRNLQRAHLEMISGIVLDPAPGTPEDAVTLARHDLVVLKDTISSLLNGSGRANLDEMTIAHLEETLSRINLTLSAPIMRGGEITVSLGF